MRWAAALCAQVTGPLAATLDLEFAHDGTGGLELRSVTAVP